MSLNEWSELLKLPSVHSVRDLRMTRLNGSFPIDEREFLTKIASLPDLTSFTLIQRFADHSACFPALAPCLSLTRLTVLDAEWSSCLPHLNLFLGLKRLVVIEPCVRFGILHTFLGTSVNLHRTLEHLELDGLHFLIAAGDLAESMAKFTRLASVVLRRIRDPDVLLAALLSAPALASLTLEPLSRTPAVYGERDRPAPERYLPDEHL